MSTKFFDEMFRSDVKSSEKLVAAAPPFVLRATRRRPCGARAVHEISIDHRVVCLALCVGLLLCAVYICACARVVGGRESIALSTPACTRAGPSSLGIYCHWTFERLLRWT